MSKEKELSVVKNKGCEDLRVVAMEPVGPHTYRVTTESTTYGRVTQDVVVFPKPDLADIGQNSAEKRS